MFSNHRITAPLERHIYSFLVEGNLDLAHRNFLTAKRKDGSTLSILRSVNKTTKTYTDAWQEKWVEFRKILNSHSNIKSFLSHLSYLDDRIQIDDIENSFTGTLIYQEINPFLNNLSQSPTENVLKILVEVLQECHDWKVIPELKSNNPKDLIKFTLNELFIKIQQMRENRYNDQKNLKIFKMIVLRQILRNLFKTKKNAEIEIQSIAKPLLNELKNTPPVRATDNERCFKFAISSVCFIFVGSGLLGALLGSIGTDEAPPLGYACAAAFFIALTLMACAKFSKKRISHEDYQDQIELISLRNQVHQRFDQELKADNTGNLKLMAEPSQNNIIIDIKNNDTDQLNNADQSNDTAALLDPESKHTPTP